MAFSVLSRELALAAPALAPAVAVGAGELVGAAAIASTCGDMTAPR